MTGRLALSNGKDGGSGRIEWTQGDGHLQVTLSAPVTRYSLGAVPQYGGTVGGVRLSALAGVGGRNVDMLAEDTDLTYRLLLRGWHTAYLNHAECYEEVPQNVADEVKAKLA